MSRRPQPSSSPVVASPEPRTSTFGSLPVNRPRATAIALGLAGLVLGLLAAFGVNAQPPRYQATATLVMTPSSGGTPVDDASLWEVLSRGQATRTTALILGSERFLPPGAAASGATYEVGAVPETTLLEAKVQASDPRKAEQILAAALENGVASSQGVSGPFALKIANDPAGSAVKISSSGAKVYVALGGGGLVAGLVLAALWVRFARVPKPAGESTEASTPLAAETVVSTPAERLAPVEAHSP